MAAKYQVTIDLVKLTMRICLSQISVICDNPFSKTS